MINRTVSKRYAKVLFDLDRNKDFLALRLEHFGQIIKILNENPNLRRFLQAPHIVQEEKRKILQEIFKEKFDPQFWNFLGFLIRKGRFDNLSHISTEYKLLVDEYLGLWEADITTAVPIDAECEAKLKAKMEKDFHKKIKLNKTVDPKLIGGAILVISNEMFDWSVIGRLRKLKENLIETQI
jgi:F-type H+-transporting ATPase subunit delta